MGRNIISRNGAAPSGANLLGGPTSGRNIIGRNGSLSHGGGTSAPSGHHGDGLLGEIEHVGKVAASPFHAAGGYIAKQGEDVGTGLYGIGTGLYDLGKSEGQTVYNDARGRNNKLNNKEWSDLFHGHIGRMFNEAAKAKGPNSPEAQLSNVVYGSTIGYGKQIKHVAGHPGENLFQTALTVLPLLGGVAGVAGRAADATAAARAGMGAADVARVAAKGTEPGVRTLKVPGNRLEVPTGPKGERLPGPAAKIKTSTEVQLNQGRSYLSRYGAKAHDVVAQRSLNKIESKGRAGAVGRYALARGSKSLEENANTTANVRETRVAQLERAKIDKGLSKSEASLATILHAGNVLPEEMASVWRQAAHEGVVRVPQEDGTVVSSKVTPRDRQRMLARAKTADSLAAKGALRMGQEGVEVNQERFPLLHARSQLVRQASDIRNAAIHATNRRPTAEGLQVRQNLVARVAGVDRQGSAFVSLKPREKQSVLSSFARSNKGSIPQTKGIQLGQHATGVGLALGHLPGDAAREVAGGLRAANRVRNTNDLRGATAAHGHDVRQTPDDWLVAKDLPSKVGTLPDELKVMLGKLRDTSLAPEEEHALIGKWNTWVNENLVNRHATEDVGQRAPNGWTWVHKNLVPDSLKHNAQARGTIERQLAKVSTGITGATVFFKPGHIPQRLTTNLSANVMHGIINPADILKTKETFRALSKPDRQRLAAATGTHGYQSLPMEGVGFTARATRAGANWYAKHIDAFFRQHAALTELRRVGYDTPEKVTKALDAVEHGAKLPGHELMKITGAFRRANREAMDYETNALEKRTVQRALWFYGFSKAATRFAGHTLTEHPGKAATLGRISTLGHEQKRLLGPVPSFEGGLTALGGKGNFPYTVDLSTLIPAGTVAREAQAVQHPLGEEGIQSFLNPVYAGLQAIEQGKGAKGFFGQAAQPTPEFQALEALAHPRHTGGSPFFPTADRNLFGRTWQSAILRALTGAALTPRRTNVAKLNEYARREHEKKRMITVYSP